MRQGTYSTEGIVLGRRITGEADRILTIFSKRLGKIKVLAKGVRKPKSRKRGHIEIFTCLKFSATKLSGIDLMTEAEIIHNFSQTRGNLKKVALAYYFVEVVGKITREGEKNNELFDLLFSYLERLEGDEKLKKLRADFVTEILVTMGFWPGNKEPRGMDKVLEEVLEKNINALRVGRQMLQ